MTDAQEVKPLVLYSKLAEVMGLAGRIEKRGENTFHHYKYAMESDIVEAVRLALAERHVMLIPAVRQVVREGTLTTALMAFTFTDGETGETATHEWAGTGDDKGDKGLYKAMTGALKYFLLKTFLMPTGDDPEADESTDKRTHGEPKAKRGPPVVKGSTCLRCSAEAVPGSPYCATCNRLAAERKADDAKRSAPPPAKPPATPAGVAERWEEPATDIRKERNRAFGLMNLHGFTAGEPGRGERLKFYARALKRTAISEAEAKTMTPAEWRTIGDLIQSENEPPAESETPAEYLS